MSFIKNNTLLIAILIFALSLFTILILLSINYSSETERLINEITDKQEKIDDHQSDILPYLGLDYELSHARLDLDKLALIERDQNRLWNSVLSMENNLAKNWRQKDIESINSMLTRQYTQLRKLCREKHIILPGNKPINPSIPFLPGNDTSASEFGFGFTAYDGNWPNFSVEEAQKLGIQLEIIKQIVGFLAKSVIDDHPLRLIYISRESVGPIDDRNIGDDKLDVINFNTKLLKPHDIVDSLCFEITFIGITSHARSFMNQLSPPYLLRDFVADRDTANISTNSFPAPPTEFSPDLPNQENAELPIVQDVRSKYSFLIEYVIDVNRDHEQFFKKTMNDESIEIEVMTDFLEKSGHSKIIKPLIQYFKDRDDS